MRRSALQSIITLNPDAKPWPTLGSFNRKNDSGGKLFMTTYENTVDFLALPGIVFGGVSLLTKAHEKNPTDNHTKHRTKIPLRLRTAADCEYSDSEK